MMERDDKDYSVDPMLMPMMMSSNTTENIIPKPIRPGPKPSNNTHSALFENEESFLQGIILSGEAMQNGSISNINNSDSLSFGTRKSDQIAVKRQQPSSFWNEVVPMGGEKRFHGDLNSCTSTTSGGGTGTGTVTTSAEISNSFVSILNQTASFHHHQNALLGSVNDGVLHPQFQLPSMNWNS